MMEGHATEYGSTRVSIDAVCCLLHACRIIKREQTVLPPTVLTVCPLVDVQGQQVQAPTQVVKDTTSL